MHKDITSNHNLGTGARGQALQALSRKIENDSGAIRDLAGAAMLLASLDHPEEKTLPQYRLFEELQESVAAAVAQTGGNGAVAELGAVIGQQFKFSGDRKTYDDMQNADFIQVLQRRRGLPVALGIIYIHCARTAGLKACGISFPSHFLVRIETGTGQSLLDPFDSGKVLQARELRSVLKRHLGSKAELSPEHYAPVSDRDVLLRLQNNILTRALQAKDMLRGKDILQRMIAIAPENAGLYRELGAITLRMGDQHQALEYFQTFYEQAKDDTTRMKAAALVQQLRKHLVDDDRLN